MIKTYSDILLGTARCPPLQKGLEECPVVVGVLDVEGPSVGVSEEVEAVGLESKLRVRPSLCEAK